MFGFRAEFVRLYLKALPKSIYTYIHIYMYICALLLVLSESGHSIYGVLLFCGWALGLRHKVVRTAVVDPSENRRQSTRADLLHPVLDLAYSLHLQFLFWV